MQNRYQIYKDYSVEAFLLDEDFLSWIKTPSEEKNSFWEGFLKEYPQKREVLESAKVFAVGLHFLPDQPAADSIDRVWKQILEGAALGKSRVVPFSRKRWWAAAAVLFVLATGSYFIWRQAGDTNIAKVNVPKPKVTNDLVPGGNKAILTLANGTSVVLDSINDGTLTRQGNVIVIKQDGQLAYTRGDSAGNEVLYNTITTPRGGQYQLVLADGTRVWLNAASSLRYPTSFAGSERLVEITGEAYFEVAKNKAMPFMVNVDGKGTVEVLGTHFNINAYRDEQAIRSTLLEGSIRFTELENKKAIVIAPGQQVMLSADGSMSLNKKVDLESVIAWKNGSFHFNNLDIVSIMRQIGRWYDVDVVYAGPLSHETYSGIVSRMSKISEVLSLMEDSGVKFKVEGNKILVQF